MLEPFQGHSPQVHPEAFVHRAAVLIGQVEVGAESSIWPACTLRADDGPIKIGAQTSIQDGTQIHMTENLSVTTVGDRVTVGHGVILHGCTIEDECLIGMGAIVLDNAVVGRGSLVGAGALIPPGKRVPPGSVVMGSPFQIVREVGDRERKQLDFSWRAYVKRAAEYRAALFAAQEPEG